MKNEIKERIAWEVIKTLISRFNSFPEDASKNRNAPFHEKFLNAFADKLDDKMPDILFFISLSSWLHGLNTSLGQSFFETVAQILSDGEKREYTSKKLGNLKITAAQKENINRIITKLSTSEVEPNFKDENAKIFIKHNQEEETEKAIDFSADVFFEDNNSIIAIELKTVKPNSGEMRGEKQKILEGKAALFNKYTQKEISFYIGFPFDPTSDHPTEFNKTRFLRSNINMIKYFDPKETLIANELWDFLSGEKKTMENILSIINDISTVNFQYNFFYLNDADNRNHDKYLELLAQWHLYSEWKLVKNNETIQRNISKDKKFLRIYNQKPFKTNGQYNYNRYLKLKTLIT